MRPPKKPLSPERRLEVTPSDALARPDSLAHGRVRSPGPLGGPARDVLASVRAFRPAESARKWDCWVVRAARSHFWGDASASLSTEPAPFCTPTDGAREKKKNIKRTPFRDPRKLCDVRISVGINKVLSERGRAGHSLACCLGPGSRRAESPCRGPSCLLPGPLQCSFVTPRPWTLNAVC